MAEDISADSHPKLRWPLDVQHLQKDGQHFLVLRDPSGVAVDAALVPTALLAIISRFDGQTSVRRIAEAGREFGVTEDLVRSIAAELDRLWLLDNRKTRSRWESLKTEFAAEEVRQAALCGGAYPNSAAELSSQLQGYIREHGVAPFVKRSGEKIIGLVSPHIDYTRGWRSYGAAYSALEQTEDPRVIILLGTSHQSGESIYRLTNKHFSTPLGTLRSASETVRQLAATYGELRSFRDEILHKREHSIELQLPFILHRFRNGRSPLIVPILVGSFHQFVSDGISPSQSEEVSLFVGALAEALGTLRGSGADPLVYCGVDLAHVGMHFGDSERVSDSDLPVVEARDKLLLEALISADEEALFAHIAEDGDSRRICGFPAVYTALAALRSAGVRPRGRLIDYRQAVESASDCIVTFASLCWTEGG